MPNIDVNGAQIHYGNEGYGDPVVLVHSSACSGGQWRALIDHLGLGFHCLTPDLHGYGQSGFWPGERPLRLADESEIVERTMALGGGPVHLVGHSYGGAVALMAALRRPELVKSLTLIEPVALHLLRHAGERGASAFAELRGVADDVTQAVATGDHQAAMVRFVDYWNGPGSWSELSDKQRGALIRVAPKVVLDFWAITAESAGFSDYGQVDVPTLLMCGEVSPRPTRRITALLGGTLPGALVHIIGGAGHMLPLTHAEQVNPIIAEHLACYSIPERQAA